MKLILLLCGAAMSLQLVGMELRTLWPKDYTPLVVVELAKAARLHDLFSLDLISLARVNRELSQEVPYEWLKIRAHKQGRLPLELVTCLRGFYDDPTTILQQKKWLRVAKKLLDNKFDPNARINTSRGLCQFNLTILQNAACVEDRELCRLLLEHGGDPYLTTTLPESGCKWTAFDYANKGSEGGKSDGKPHEWLKQIWYNVEKNKQTKDEPA